MATVPHIPAAPFDIQETRVISTVKRRATPQTLLQFPALAQLPPASLQRLAQASSVEEIPAGRLLFKPGLRDDQELYLLRGEVALASNQCTVGHVEGGTDAANQPLAPEHPRRLWGWATSKIHVLCVDAGLAAALRTLPPPVDAALQEHAPHESGAEPGRRTDDLRRALEDAERERQRTVDELAAVRQRLADSEQELERTRERLRSTEAALAEATGSAAAAPADAIDSPAIDSPATDATPVAAPAQASLPGDRQDELAVPSLRLDPGQRGTLAPAELDDLLDGASFEVGPDTRRRSH